MKITPITQYPPGYPFYIVYKYRDGRLMYGTKRFKSSTEIDVSIKKYKGVSNQLVIVKYTDSLISRIIEIIDVNNNKIKIGNDE